MNLAHWLDRAAKAYPNRPALMTGQSVVADYATFARRSAALAGSLRAAGRAPGDRIAIIAGNCTDYLDILFGLWWGGFAAVPINAKLHGAEIGWILEHSDAVTAFVGADLETEIAAHAPDTLQALTVIGSAAYRSMIQAEQRPILDRSPNDLAWLFYTSGTTGRPKGAMLTHRNLMAMSLAYLTDVDPTSPGQTLLHAAPMSHGSGLYAMAHVARFAVNAVPESGGFDPAEIMGFVNARPETSMFAAPTMTKRLVDCPDDVRLGAFRTIIWGGAPMLVPDIRRALDRFGPVFAQIYGQGETPMTTTVLSKADITDHTHPRWLERLGSAGIVNSVVEVRVGDAEDRALPLGEAGEVLVRGDTVMAGYWADQQATAETLRGGWLHTGDVGVFDADGYLTLKDRSKDLIISGGSNVYPREVEEVLIAHPAVKEVSVIGRPDPDWGEVVVAFVVGDADPATLDAHCLEKIARFKRPKDYVFVDALPKNNYGKILKTELREMDRDSRSAETKHGS